MADIWSQAKRSEVMSRIRGSGNRSTEQRLAALFRSHSIKGWRRHLPLPGRPDFTFRRLRLVVFVDGCFWHGCPQHGTLPRQNGRFWRQKISRNRERDREVSRELRRRGWRVIRIWEHELKRTLGPKVKRLLIEARG
jgi:DNA mismatch endonuclease (patch repair protein)